MEPFQFSANDSFLTIKISGQFDEATGKRFETEVQPFLAKPQPTIINCEGLVNLSPANLRCLLLVAQKLKTAVKPYRMVSMAATIQAILREKGLNSTFPSSPSLKAALADIGVEVKTRSLDVNFINPFLKSTAAMLKVQASTEARAGAPYKKGPQDPLQGDISAIISMVADQFSGCIVVTFPATTFLKIMSKMLGEEYTQITKEIQDGAAEMANIIFAQARVELNERGYNLKTAIPTVISGPNHSVGSSSMGPRVVIPFESDVGPFSIEIGLSA